MGKKKKPPKCQRATKAEITKRKNWFKLRCGRGLSTTQLIEMAMDEFSIEERQAYRYYEMAMVEIEQIANKSTAQLLGQWFNEIDFALQKAYTDKNPGEVSKLLETKRKGIESLDKRRIYHDTENKAQAGFSDQLGGFLRALEGDGRTH